MKKSISPSPFTATNRRLLPLLGLLAFSLATQAHALVSTLNATGDWDTAANWDQTGGLHQVPGSVQADGVIIRANRTATVDQNVVGSFNVTAIQLGDAGGINGTVSIVTGGILATGGNAGNFEVMRRGAFSNVLGTLNMSGGSLSIAGTGTGGNLFVGSGTSNTGSGGGTVNLSGGTLSVLRATTIGSSTADLGSGTFNVTGDAATFTGSTLTVDTFGTMNFLLDSTGISTLSFSGLATFNTGSTLFIDGSAYTGGTQTFTLIDAATLSGSLTNINDSITGFGGGYLASLSFDNTGGSPTNNVFLTVTAVPEPRTVALLSLGLFSLLFVQRRRFLARA